MNKSEAVFKELEAQGARHVFFVAGGNAMYLNEALRASNLTPVPMHHEQACAMAAEAYARRTGRVGVCMATSGPGVSNLVTGVAGAYLDSVPMVAIIGQSKEQLPDGLGREFSRQAGLFELNNRSLLEGVTKDFKSIQEGDSAALLTRQAVNVAVTGRPGPVVLELSLKVQPSEETNSGFMSNQNVFRESPKTPKPSFPNKAFNRPLVLVGRGVQASGSAQRLRDLLEKFELPFITTHLAKDFSFYSHPLFIGHSGPRGNRSANVALSETDLLISIGSTLGSQIVGYEPSLFAPQAVKIIQESQCSVSSIREFAGETSFVDYTVEEFIDWLEDQMKNAGSPRGYGEWVRRLTKLKVSLNVHLEPHIYDETGHNLYRVVRSLNDFMVKSDREVNVVSDAGLAFYILGQALELGPRSSYTVSGGLGAMGYALPASIGIGYGKPQGLTVAVTGDGSSQMNVQEFATLSQMQSPVAYVIINNGGYASIRNTQDSFFGARVGSSGETGVVMPDWRSVARAYGLDYCLVSSKDSLQQSFSSAIDVVSPRVVEVECQEHQAVIPFTPNYVDEFGKIRSRPLQEMQPSPSEANDGFSTMN